ncbi:MAG: hypothetical protein L0H64_24560, partial [Pseudonocardia sp.]|nr:hypothetical protein [Pseudonocardia sp.]
VLGGAAIAVVFLMLGLPSAGSVLFGAEVAATGVAFTALSLVCAQVLSHARAATGLGAVLVGAAFAIRAVGDVGGGTLSWFSPIGWVQAAHPFGDDRWWPLVIPVAMAAAAAYAAWRLDSMRDVGGSLVAQRLGPATASPSLASVPAWAFRMQRAGVSGWAAGMLLAGAALGSVGSQVADMVRGNEQMEKVFGGSGEIVDEYFAMVALLLGLLAAVFAASTVLRLRGEETSGRAEVLLVAGVPRRRWMIGWLAVTTAATVGLAVCGAIGAAVAEAMSTGDASQLPRIFGAMLVPLPAVAVIAGLAAALAGLAPRVQHATWAVVAWAFVTGWFGDLLELPGWAIDLSPFSWVPEAPAEPMGWAAWLVTLAVAAVLTVAGVEGLRRRAQQGQGYAGPVIERPIGSRSMRLIRPAASLVTATAIALALSGTPAAAAGEGDWTQYRKDATNNARVMTQQDIFTGALPTANEVRATPVVADGSIFVGNHDTGELQAFDLATGDLQWQSKAP